METNLPSTLLAGGKYCSPFLAHSSKYIHLVGWFFIGLEKSTLDEGTNAEVKCCVFRGNSTWSVVLET